MKKLLLILPLIALCGCAQFQTTQKDITYDTKGTPSRQIETRVHAITVFSAKSELAKFRAAQTDKSQTAAVGSLNISATNHVVDALKEINAILEKMPK